MVKEARDLKDGAKDRKELAKDRKDVDDGTKDQGKEHKDLKDGKEWSKEVTEAGKERKDLKDRVETRWLDKDVTREGPPSKKVVERPGRFGQPAVRDELAQASPTGRRGWRRWKRLFA